MSEKYYRQYLRVKELVDMLGEDMNGVTKCGAFYYNYTIPVKEIEMIRAELMKLKKMLRQGT